MLLAMYVTCHFDIVPRMFCSGSVIVPVRRVVTVCSFVWPVCDHCVTSNVCDNYTGLYTILGCPYFRGVSAKFSVDFVGVDYI